MPTKHRKLIALFLLFFFSFLLASYGQEKSPAANAKSTLQDNVLKHASRLMEFKNRLAGRKGCTDAAAYIHEQLKGFGYEMAEKLPYKITVPKTRQCVLTLSGGEEVSLFPLWPNGTQTCSFSNQGLDGEFIYARKGEFADFNGRTVKNSIVFMDMDSGYNWRNAVMLGAAVVVFVEKEPADFFEFRKKMVSQFLDFPRFYIQHQAIAKFIEANQGKKINLRSNVRWENRITENVYAFKGNPAAVWKELLALQKKEEYELPKKRFELEIEQDNITSSEKPDNARLEKIEKELEQINEELKKCKEKQQAFRDKLNKDLIVITAEYDAFSLVPDLAPGGVNAMNSGLLLELARRLSKENTNRNVLFLFTSGNGQRYAGIRNFLWTVWQKRLRRGWNTEDLSASAVLVELNRELERLDTVIHCLQQEKPFEKSGDETFSLEQKIKDEAGKWSDELSKQIAKLRLKPEEKRTEEDENKIKSLSRKISAINTVRLEVPNFDWDERETKAKKLEDTGKKEEAKKRREDIVEEQRAFRKLASMALDTNKQLKAELEFKVKKNKKDQRVSWIADKRNVSNIFCFELKLSSGNNRFGLFCDGFLNKGEVRQRLFTVVKEVNTQLEKLTLDKTVFEENTIIGTRSWKDFVPFKVSFGVEDFVTHGYYGLAVATVDDFRYHECSPSDTLENIRVNNFMKQAEFVPEITDVLLNNEDVTYTTERAQSGYIKGRVVAVSGTSATPKSGVSHAVVVCRPAADQAVLGDEMFGILESQVVVSNVLGEYRIPGLKNGSSYACEPFAYDENGILYKVPDSCGEAPGSSKVNVSVNGSSVVKTVLFEANGLSFCGFFDPLYFQYMNTIRAISSVRNTTPPRYYASTESGVATVFIPSVNANDKIKVVGAKGAFDNHILLLNNDLKNPKKLINGKTPLAHGTGYSPARHFDRFIPLEAASNMWCLDEYRISNLRKRNVTSTFLDELHAGSKTHLDEALKAYEKKEYDKAYIEAMNAWAFERRVYPGVIKTSNDVVKAVIILLLIALPFAFILERLFIAARNVYTRIISFLLFFGSIFMLLYFVHPAFQLTMTPMIIILAFALLTMSSLVIYILFRKFEEEVKRMHGVAATVHSTDIKRAGTALAVVQIGISNMRRRRVRTGITAITLIILTFSVMCFASFKNALKEQQRWVSYEAPPYQGILLRETGWKPIEEKVYAFLKDVYKEDCTVSPRIWVSARPSEKQLKSINVISEKDSSRSTIVRGFLGILPCEDTVTNISDICSGDWAAFKNGENVCFLPNEIMEEVLVKPNDYVNVMGLKVKVLGGFDHDRLNDLKSLKSEPLTPVDFTDAQEERRTAAQGTQTGDIMAQAAAEKTYEHIGASQIGIIPYSLAKKMRGYYSSIAIKPNDATKVKEEAVRLAKRTRFILYAGLENGIALFSSLGFTSAEQAQKLIIPLLIGALIVFNTMLGAVYERGEEIFTYTSVGLAPLHVGLLFLAEAFVFAILGGMGGYLVSQVVAKAINILTEMGVQADLLGISMNYSSISAMITILVIMIVVVLSALYPAKVASESANPGLQREWKIPEPVDDRYDIEFPFTLPKHEVIGICIFVKEHFLNHTDSSLGVFSSGNPEVFSEGEEAFGIQSTIWLAPFDLGVSQFFKLTCKPSDIKGIYEINIILDKISGQTSSWKRTNRSFLKNIRKQFLIWRTLLPEVVDDYHKQGLTELGLSKEHAQEENA